MPKFENKSAMFQKIPIENIITNGNVRFDYKDNDVINLAESIRKNGLLQPLVVRPSENGIFQLIAGHRRLFAMEFLNSRGNDFSLIPCVIQTSGKIRTLQMLENIQRKDLTPEEKEAVVTEMLDSGMTASEIAEEFSKPLTWVTDIKAGTKVRKIAENAGVDTSTIGTKALSQLRSIGNDELPAAVEELSQKGGTFRAATEILHEHKEKAEDDFIETPEISESVDTGKVIEKTDVLIQIKTDTCEWLEMKCTELGYPGFGIIIDELVKIAKKKKLM